MVAAGYCMYGSMAYMMITTGKGTAGFTLDPTLGACLRGVGVCARASVLMLCIECHGTAWALCCSSTPPARLAVFPPHPGSSPRTRAPTPPCPPRPPARTGEFVITHPQVQIPARGTIYSINEGNAANWDAATTKCGRAVESSLGSRPAPGYTSRP